ncbi:MAG: transglutaminase-like domain-containing protein [Candidatus Helarchaeota archaeon]
MKVIITYSNKILLLRGKIDSGFVKWALLGFSNHHLNPRILSLNPQSKTRIEGEEKNTFAYIKLPKLYVGDEFHFTSTIEFNTINLNIPLIKFSFQEYSNQIINKYCSYSKFWPIYDSEIIEIVNRLKKKSGDDVKQFLKNTYKFVIETIKFRENMKERLGATRILKEKIGDCDEFSDLFITILRSARIPSRRVAGIFISNKKSEFHAWSEVYIPHYNKFIPFDIALDLFSRISKYHIVRLKMANSNRPPFIYVKYKGSSNVKLVPIENDLEKIEIIE